MTAVERDNMVAVGQLLSSQLESFFPVQETACLKGSLKSIEAMRTLTKSMSENPLTFCLKILVEIPM